MTQDKMAGAVWADTRAVGFSGRTRAPVLASVSLIALLSAAPMAARAADCATDEDSSGIYVCTGDVLEFDLDVTELDDEIIEILIEDVDDSTDEGTYLFQLENIGDEGDSHGDDGDDVREMLDNYDGDDTEISVTGGDSTPVVSLLGEGGKGHSGKDRTSDTSSGHGGNAGDGGDVSGFQGLTISGGTISGDGYSFAVVTGSGGDGGEGGKGRSYFTSNGTGGDGGEGGDGNAAEFTIESDASISLTTDTDDQAGIYVFSSGGDGGDGGKGEGGTNAKGGDGGSGGDAGDASVTIGTDVTLDITTNGDLSHGIQVLSQGGDGGDGGEGTGSTGDSSGGDGGAGGDADFAFVYAKDATITTTGDDSIGVLARSYGGAGGDGGDADSTFGSGSGGSSLGGGTAGEVEVEVGGTITTTGSGSDTDDDGDDDSTTSSGILAQSVGGFSGDAGDSAGLFVAYGASSESAGDANTVKVTVFEGSTISTSGTYSDAIEAQSIGGGGGKGGSADSIDSVGGDGSAGGDGGTVTVTVDGSEDNMTSITTSNLDSAGITAQSVGGGGGKSGGSDGVVSVGGTGGTGGDGGTVTVSLAGDIETNGENAEGVFAQSIGGGGGKAKSTTGMISSQGGTGGDGGDGGTVTFTHKLGDIVTKQDDSDGVDLQSIGGGGGKAKSSSSVSVAISNVIGGDGGDGGDGADVTYAEEDDDYAITTGGDYASGISAQSGGGGGGNAGNATSVAVSVAVSVSVGSAGDGGAGGDGGAVTVDTNANIGTTGTHADGIFAQSFGGGGGNAGDVTSVSAGVDLVSVAVAVGADGADGGDGDDVSVTSGGQIITTDDYSNGIYAQSAGGGGGKASSTYAVSTSSVAAIDVSVGASGGTGGDAGAVTVENTGDITTGSSDDEGGGGVSAAGIYAQSSGGGGGNSGQSWAADAVSFGSVDVSVGGDGGSGGDADAVSVVNSGDITTYQTSSDGIFAQSQGGSGGTAKTTMAASGASVIGSLSIGLGGDSGDGSAAGLVNVLNDGDITVQGDTSTAIYAESAGGGGGSSQSTVAASGMQTGSIDVSVGGSGGTGASADTVYVFNSGTLDVQGEAGMGIYAASRAGSGGNASTVVSTSGASSGSVDVGVGAEGGDGGTASDVTVYNNGAISTGGSAGYGILAQSVGGAGGNSSAVTILALNVGSEATDGASGGIEVAVGADGGDGGSAGAVTVENLNEITTTEDLSDAIIAQSLGGSGGNAGTIYAVQVDAGSESGSASFSMGGAGGGGSTSDTVTVTNDGTITTEGYYSRGIFAQSQGGSGGSGGSVTSVSASLTTSMQVGLSIAMGGAGGDGAVGGQVDVTNSGDITTKGSESDGIYAQSLGGDGGSGGYALAYAVDLTYAVSDSAFGLDIAFANGGDGGSGNDADLVQVTNYGTITTEDSNSNGIFAQSVGGGGGDAGSAEATAVAFTVDSPDDFTDQTYSVSVEVGGTGGAAGDGGQVKIDNQGDITTELDISRGIFAQSVGGGGGTGGDSGTSGSAASVGTDIIDGIVSVFSIASLAKDYSSYFTKWTISLGGEGGAAGDGDTVEVSNSATIETSGDDATGIYAQSVGGGGGVGGTGTGASVSTQVELGGYSGAGGHGGDVTVTNTGDITTSGARANGIWAQSVGGGGGDAGDVEGAFGSELSDVGFTFSIDIGLTGAGDAGNGGDGGDVSVTSTDADITVTGENSVGVWAQSVGGGGGSVGSYGTINASEDDYGIGSNGSEGDSGTVTVTLEGSAVSATAEDSIGIFAQSSSGAYNTDDDTSDLDSYFEYDGDDSYEAGNVTIQLTDGASVTTTGTDGMAIVAASTGYDKAGEISISVDSDSSISGSDGNAHVISLYDGKDNGITNYGTIEDGDFTDTDRDDDIYVIYSSVSSDDYDISDDDGVGALSILNEGTISGSLKLHEGATGNWFDNGEDGTFNMGTTVDLGDGDGLLTNAGIVSPGGVDQIFTSTVSGGTYEQNAAGIMLFDLAMDSDDSDDSADLLIADTVALLDGTVEINVTDAGDIADGDSGAIVVAVIDDLSDDDPDLNATDSAIVDYEVTVLTDQDITVGGTTYSDSNGVQLSYTVDVGSSGASVNTTNLTSYVASSDDDDDDFGGELFLAQMALGTAAVVDAPTDGDDEGGDTSEVQAGLQSLFLEMLNAPTLAELEAIGAAHVLDETGAALYAARRASASMHNDLRQCEVYSASTGLRQQDCGWVGFVGSDSHFDNDAGGSAIDESTYGLSAGGQRRLDSGLILGGMLRGERVSLNGTGFAQDGNRFTFGAVLQHEAGPLTYSVSAGYGRQDLSQTRSYTLSGTTHQARADVVGHVASADARVSYVQSFDQSYLRWGLGLGVYYTQQNGFTENGTGPLNWAIQSTDDTDVVLRPSVEFGHDFGQGRVFVSAGLAASLTDPQINVQGDLVGVSSGAPMSHLFGYDRVTAEIGLGVDYQLHNDMRLSIRGGGAISENTRSGDISARLQWLF